MTYHTFYKGQTLTVSAQSAEQAQALAAAHFHTSRTYRVAVALPKGTK